MEKNTIAVSCVKKYVNVGGKYNNKVYALAPGEEWGHLYLCRKCGEVIYSYNTLRDINQCPCPKCKAQAENNFLDYPRNIMLDGKLYELDHLQIDARFDELTEFATFPHVKIIKNNTIMRPPK